MIKILIPHYTHVKIIRVQVPLMPIYIYVCVVLSELLV